MIEKFPLFFFLAFSFVSLEVDSTCTSKLSVESFCSSTMFLISKSSFMFSLPFEVSFQLCFWDLVAYLCKDIDNSFILKFFPLIVYFFYILFYFSLFVACLFDLYMLEVIFICLVTLMFNCE
jgi:hypothetical protein